MKYLTTLITGIALLSGTAYADAVQINIADAKIATSMGNHKVGSAYLTISNPGQTPITLQNVTSPLADRVEIHTHVQKGEMMAMEKLDKLEIAAGTKAEFKPGGLHLMLFGLKEPVDEDAEVPLLLDFGNGMEMQVVAHGTPMQEMMAH